MAIDLAYTLGNTFGEQFDSWQKKNQASSANAKVDFFQIFYHYTRETLMVLKVRHFVRTWESNFGDSATPQAMIEALQKVKPKHQDIIDRISKNCL